MADFVIRPATAADSGAIGAVGHAAWLVGIGPHVGPDAHARITPETFARFGANGWAEILVADLDGAVAGFAGTGVGGNYISDVWVAPAFESRGIATALIGGIERVIVRRGHATAEIEVLSANVRALRLYRHLGYAVAWEGGRDDPVLAVELPKTRLSKNLG